MSGAVIDLKGKVKDEELEEGPDGEKDDAGAFVEEELVETGAKLGTLWRHAEGGELLGDGFFDAALGWGCWERAYAAVCADAVVIAGTVL